MRPLLAFLFAMLPATAASAMPINVVASFSILGDMVREVGGERVAVTTIVGPDADAHVYEPRPADAAAVAAAKLFVVNGLGFEGWMDRLVGSTGNAASLLIASEGVLARQMVEDGTSVPDPHAWQSLANGAIYVDNIARGLCRVDPEGCGAYEANAKTYAASLLALDQGIRSRIERLAPDQRKVLTSHDAFGYFALEYGVTFLSPEGLSTDAEPSAADVAGLILQIRAEKVTALFFENMSDPRLLEQIARETGLRPGGALYADALSGPQGPAPTYVDMFRHNADLLIAAMGE